MGQQQLLLLVLATVIVGLATVAGIQAFDEGQAQASQDALVQRATDLASDIKAAESKPAQLGGVTIGSETIENDDGSEEDVPVSSANDIAKAIGVSQATGISAQGAGGNAACDIETINSGSEVTVTCDSDDAQQGVQVTFDPDGDPQITTDVGDYSTN
jgi:hypothetical protein